MKPVSYLFVGICLLFLFVAFSLKPFQPTFAVCGNVSDYPTMSAIGYKYVEANVAYLIPDKSDAEFQVHLDEIKRTKARIISCTSFFPGKKITGPAANHSEVLVWADSALRRAKMAKIPYIVFGSGGARRVPEGFSKEEATNQLIAFCKQLAPLAMKYDVIVVIEPLNKGETNLINSLSEGAQIVEAVNHPNILLLCDIYHMMKEKEPPSEIVKYGKYIRHCHIAEEKGRARPGTSCDDFKPYFQALNKIGYKGCISIECKWKEKDAEMQPALKYMQQQISSL